ncbi:uncharacterized protein J3R85_008362 [Psidium guajava]|nr:uncharacterized protein J3R85_008362 [Psidium guajava]
MPLPSFPSPCASCHIQEDTNTLNTSAASTDKHDNIPFQICLLVPKIKHFMYGLVVLCEARSFRKHSADS